jgi:hypothetical protein
VTSLPARPATFAFLSARFSFSVFDAAVLLDDFFGDLSDTVTPFDREPGRPRGRNPSAGSWQAVPITAVGKGTAARSSVVLLRPDFALPAADAIVEASALAATTAPAPAAASTVAATGPRPACAPEGTARR